MKLKLFLAALLGAAVSLNADILTEYFQGTVISNSYQGNPGDLYTVAIGTPISGSFSFDTSLPSSLPMQTQNGLYAVNDIPVTITIQDLGGSLTQVGPATTSGVSLSSYAYGYDYAEIESTEADGSSMWIVGLTLPDGAVGNLSLAQFPWGVQPALGWGDCNTQMNAYTCSTGLLQTSLMTDNGVADDSLRFSIDSVCAAPEPSTFALAVPAGLLLMLVKRKGLLALNRSRLR